MHDLGGQMDLSKIYADNTKQNNEKDEMYTPDNAIAPLIKHLDGLDKEKTLIWECADTPENDSNIASKLREAGYKVITTSIHNGQDFLKTETPDGVTHIITNPPFSIKESFIKSCFDRKLPFALLMPLAALEGKVRVDMYIKNDIQLLCFDKRIKFVNKDGESMKSPPFSSCWFCNGILKKQICFEKI